MTTIWRAIAHNPFVSDAIMASGTMPTPPMRIPMTTAKPPHNVYVVSRHQTQSVRPKAYDET